MLNEAVYLLNGRSAAFGNALLPAPIDSMTLKERRDHTILNGSRKKRIAKGSGTSVQEINRLIKQFLSARTMMKSLVGGKGKPGKIGKLKRRGKLIRAF